MIQYQFALDSSGSVLSVLEMNEKNRRQKLTCPSCHEVLIPRLGEIRKPHFAHKHVTTNCNFETYLHETAKNIFFARFKHAREFKRAIYLYYWVQCNTSQVFSKYPGLQDISCEESFREQVNLARVFDHVELEEAIDGFRPDLLLSSRKHDKVLFVEIKVTHGCSQEKVNSGHKILEIMISSQDDLWALWDQPFEQYFKQESSLDITLHNFSSYARSFKSKNCSCRQKRLFATVIRVKNNRHRPYYGVNYEPLTLSALAGFFERTYKKMYSFITFDFIENSTKEDRKRVYYKNLYKAKKQGFVIENL